MWIRLSLQLSVCQTTSRQKYLIVSNWLTSIFPLVFWHLGIIWWEKNPACIHACLKRHNKDCFTYWKHRSKINRNQLLGFQRPHTLLLHSPPLSSWIDDSTFPTCTQTKVHSLYSCFFRSLFSPLPRLGPRTQTEPQTIMVLSTSCWRRLVQMPVLFACRIIQHPSPYVAISSSLLGFEPSDSVPSLNISWGTTGLYQPFRNRQNIRSYQ